MTRGFWGPAQVPWPVSFRLDDAVAFAADSSRQLLHTVTPLFPELRGTSLRAGSAPRTVSGSPSRLASPWTHREECRGHEQSSSEPSVGTRAGVRDPECSRSPLRSDIVNRRGPVVSGIRAPALPAFSGPRTLEAHSRQQSTRVGGTII